ncbi:MAG: hypothetical protein Q8Q36_01305 [bacterium]|nr:hypothetical protein [bacterium]
MRILEVVPFAKGVPPHALSYFGKDEAAAPGAIVSVPLRGKKVKGLVVAARDAAAAKSSVKASRYSLRKIDKVLGASALSDAFLKSAESTALFFAASLGETIAQTVPEYLQGKLAVRKKDAPRAARPDGPARTVHPGGLKAEKFILQRELEERLDYFRTYVRTEFAKGASVFLVLPTAEEAEHFAEEVSRGVERFAYILHGRLPKKELAARLAKLEEETHPVLVVGTPYFLALPRDDIGTVIVEHESSSAYRTVSRPYLDLRVFAEILAANSGWKIVFADALLQVETLARHEAHELTELLPLKWRIKTREECLIVDTRKKDEDLPARSLPARVTQTGAQTGGEKKKFALISETAEEAVRDAQKRRGSVFVYASRRGLHPISICGDCGTTLACPRCSSPLVLHGQGGGSGRERAFICHKCKGAVSADTPCGHCGGWKLVPLGYGTESVEEELAAAFPGEKVLRLDRDSAGTPAEARKIAEEFEKKKGGILVGSELALYYLAKPLDTIIVASIDSLASIPSFRIGEKMFQTLLSLRSRAEREFIVQTRLADKKLLLELVEGDLINFYRDELRDRRAFNFPPAVRLVKLTLEGRQPMLSEEAGRLKALFGRYSPESYNAFISKIKHLYRTHIVLRLPPREWTVPELGEGRLDKALAGLLLSLPPDIAVRVMPEDIL